MKGKIVSICLGVFIALLFLGLNSSPLYVQAALNLNGRILLQVQAQGQAYYVNPINGERYYLGRPSDAFKIMSSLGLGVSNADLANFKKQVPSRLAGRILLQVQAQGQAYYVNPLNLKLYYLGRPKDAFDLMRSQGLGITNHNLNLIPLAPVSNISQIKETINLISSSSISVLTPTSSPNLILNPLVSSNQASTSIGHFLFKYHNKDYEIFQNFSKSLYQSYAKMPKTYTYNTATPPVNLRNAFYGIFLVSKPDDHSLNNLIAKLRAVALKNHWTSDQLVEFTMALVQYIPYDQAKLSVNTDRNTDPYYPYETLYLDRGVCSDKTFLAVSLLRKLGYGAAILDFPDINHSAVGIACPIVDSINGSGYCYGETTNYFPLGVIPQSISFGQAQPSTNQFTDLFNSSRLGTIEIYQKTSGKIYQGVVETRLEVKNFANTKKSLDTQKTEISILTKNIQTQKIILTTTKTQMDNYYNSGQISQYNSLVITYNTLVNKYNGAVSAYKVKVDDYNQQVRDFNQAVNDFYQK